MEKQLVLVDPKEYGLEESKAGTIEKSFLTKQIELKSFEQQYSEILTKELNQETFKEARELRLKLVKVRTGIADVHKSEKAFYLASGKYVDALKNKLTTPIEQMEEKLKEIEEYEKRIEAERKAILKSERIKEFEPYGTDVSFMPLDEMTEEQFQGQLNIAKTAFEAKLEAERKAEEERIEAEKKAEAERLEAERLEAERLEEQRLENIRLKAEADKREKELAKKDAEAKAEQDLLAKIAAEEKAKADKLAKEIADKKALEVAALEAEEKRKRDLANAGDKALVKDFFAKFELLSFPELSSKGGKEMSVKIIECLFDLRQLIIKESKKLL